jgi:ATP-binding cassette subfamily C protein
VEVGGRLSDSSFWKYLATLLSVMPRHLALTVALTISVSLTEGVGLLLLVPLLQLVGLDTQTGSAGRLAGSVSAAVAAVGIRLTLPVVLGLYVLTAGTHALFSRWQAVAGATLEQEFVAHLREQLYSSIAHTSWLFFSRRRSSDFTHALTAELDHVGGSTYYLIALTTNTVVTSVYLVLALQLSAVMTGAVLACGAVLYLAQRGRIRTARSSGKRLSSATNQLYAAASEHLGGMKVTKSYGAEDRHVEIFSRLTRQLARLYVENAANHASAKAWFDLGAALILCCMLYLSFEVIDVSPAAALLLLFIFFRIMPKLSGIQQGYQSLVRLLPSFAAVMQLQRACQEAIEETPERREDIAMQRGVQFAQVSFAYAGAGQSAVIQAVDLTINAGETTAIVGPSGAGKTTIADLVTGLIVPTQGRLLVDDLPLTPERMHAWRARIGYVAQDAFLFHDTVRANLLWARPDASEDALRQALRLAAAEDFIDAMPEGLDTVLGDRGVRLSGGERQRLALARALLREPSLLLLDEATSSLDSENERRIQGAIEQLHGQVTIVVITHRLSTIRRADVVHVLERGRLVQSGDWDRLVAQDGRFRELCRAQGIDVEPWSDRDNGSAPALRAARMDIPSSGHDAPAGYPS